MAQTLLWGYDAGGQPTTTFRNYESAQEVMRLYELSELNVLLDADSRAALAGVRYLGFGNRIYRIVASEQDGGEGASINVKCHAAECDLGLRTVVGTMNHTGTSGAMVRALIEALTGPRALPLSADPHLTSIGTAATRQRSWGDLHETCRSLLAADGIGLAARYDGGIVITGIAPTVGDAVSSRASARMRVCVEELIWRNYAIVMGRGEGAARVRVDVDQTGGGERRELYVDADDIEDTGMTSTEYEAALYARGLEKLAEARRVEFAEAETDEPVQLGDVVWFGYPVNDWLLCTERTIDYQGNDVTVSVKLGEPELTIRDLLRLNRSTP